MRLEETRFQILILEVAYVYLRSRHDEEERVMIALVKKSFAELE